MKVKMNLYDLNWEDLVKKVNANKARLLWTDNHYESDKFNFAYDWTVRKSGRNRFICASIWEDQIQMAIIEKDPREAPKEILKYSIHLEKDKTGEYPDAMTLCYEGPQNLFLNSWVLPKFKLKSVCLSTIEVLDAEGEKLPPIYTLVERQMVMPNMLTHTVMYMEEKRALERLIKRNESNADAVAVLKELLEKNKEMLEFTIPN